MNILHKTGIASAVVSALLSGSVAAQDAARGQEIYDRHCATCHGADATGNGPMAAVLIPQPSDLSELSASNGGIFPMIRVVMRIDGSETLVSHGSPMPIWSDFLSGPPVSLTPVDGMPITTSASIADLVVYLQGLQD